MPVARPGRLLVAPLLTPKRLFVLGIVVALAVSYFGSVRGYLAQRNDLARQQLALRELIDEREGIRSRLTSLQNPAVIEARARELGFTKPGEMALRVTGLDLAPPSRPVRRNDRSFWDFLPDVF